MRDLYRGITGRLIKYGVARGRIQELVNFSEASSRENLFAGDAGEVLLEILQKLDFARGAGREVRSSAFGGRSDVSMPVPEEHGLSQSRPGGIKGFVRVDLGIYFFHKKKILWFKSLDSSTDRHEMFN